MIYSVSCFIPIAKFGHDAQEIDVQTRPQTHYQFPFQDCAHSHALVPYAAETDEHRAMNWNFRIVHNNETPIILEIVEFRAAFQDVSNGRKHFVIFHHCQ